MNEIPQHAIETLPERYTILGRAGEFELIDGKDFEGIAYNLHKDKDCWWHGSWSGNAAKLLYAAPTDSEIVKHNWVSLPIVSKLELHPFSGPKSVYIAGPMRGKQYFNFPAFDAACDKLKEQGWNPISPADIDRKIGFDAMDLPADWDWNNSTPEDFSVQDAFDRDISALKSSAAVYMLKGWQESTGAQAEYWCARWLDKEIFFEGETICEEAIRIQGGDRQQDYGSPTKNFQDIADAWNWYIRTKQSDTLEARDVAHMMILLKVARNAQKPKRDNVVDVAGYAQCLGEIDHA